MERQNPMGSKKNYAGSARNEELCHFVIWIKWNKMATIRTEETILNLGKSYCILDMRIEDNNLHIEGVALIYFQEKRSKHLLDGIQ